MLAFIALFAAVCVGATMHKQDQIEKEVEEENRRWRERNK